MKFLLTLALLLPAVFAQTEYICQCALFADQQVGSEVMTPLSFAVSKNIDPFACTFNESPNHPCAQFCLEYANNETSTSNGLCVEEPTDTSQRCTGGLMCEIMYADGHTDVVQQVLRLYYRMPECTAENSDWVNTGFIFPEALCCEGGYFDTCSSGGCACYRYSSSYCECGLFVPEMFNVLQGDEIPLPLQVVGQNSTAQPVNSSFCDIAGTLEDPCRQLCQDEGFDAIGEKRLIDIPPGKFQTYGQIYCRSLFGRVELYDKWQPLNTEIGVWERAPRCSARDWYELPIVKHYEPLCCDEFGDHVYPCPEAALH